MKTSNSKAFMKPTLYFRSAIICLISGLLSIPVFAVDTGLLDIDGEWVQGGLLFGRVASETKVTFLDRKVRVDQDGLFVIGLGRDAPKQVELLITHASGEPVVKVFKVAQRQYNIQHVEGVPAQTVNPPAGQLERIRKESGLARRARSLDFNRTDFLQSFEWPLVGPITGVYGSQRIYNGEPRSPHYGVDVARPTGTLVKAPASGIVTLVHDNMFFSGGTLIIDHGHGVSSTFIHLNKVLVEEDMEIKQGDIIAEVGATGRVTGPHLDWRMNWFTHRIDPQLLVGTMPKDVE